MASLHSLDLQFEDCLYTGIILSAILYGFYITIYFISVRVLLTNAQATRSTRIFYISFGGILVFLNTIIFPTIPLLGQLMWIVHRDEVDPLVYYEEYYLGSWYFIAANLAQAVASFLTNALLIYRCYFVFESRIWIILIPVLCSIACLVLSISDIFRISPVKELLLFSVFSIISLALDIAINIVVTTMISIKILLVARRVQKGTNLYMTHPYTGIVAILVESTAPLTVISIFLVASYVVKNSYWGVVGSLSWAIIMALTPQLIILRVAVGVAWNKQTSLELSQLGTIAFAPPPLASGQKSGGARSSTMSNYWEIESVIRMQNSPRNLEAGLSEKTRDSLTSFESIINA